MSRSAEVTLDWGDGTYVFALKWGQLIELQEKLDAGPLHVLNRLAGDGWKVEDVSQVIRLGLIGGGMDPVQALKAVRAYVEARPPLENLITAQAILSAGLMGAPDEAPGKRRAGARKAARSRVERSGSPTSTAPEPPSA